MPGDRRHSQLATVEGLVVTADVGAAEGIAIWPEGSQGRVVAGSFVVLAIALRMMAEAVVCVARAIFGAGTEALVVGTCDQRWNAVVRRGWRRLNIVVGMRSAAGREKAGQGDRKK